ncbi:MAG: hypothetical protein A2Y23_07995 [Clostridiales bacterium GWB2_37_7]|nr:MAG: hypothetical protein A2Y23_07995 [Clostridiales bacterium GWB2_37_7]
MEDLQIKNAEKIAIKTRTPIKIFFFILIITPLKVFNKYIIREQYELNVNGKRIKKEPVVFLQQAHESQF